MRREEAAERIAGLVHDVLRGLRPGRPPGPPDLQITLAQMHCMHTIEELGSPTMTDLARQLGLQPSTVTALVDALVECGLVERLEDSEDRRIVRVQQTALGRQKKEAHRRAHRRRLMECLGALEDAELVQIEAALTRLREAILATRSVDDPSDSRAGEVTC